MNFFQNLYELVRDWVIAALDIVGLFIDDLFDREQFNRPDATKNFRFPSVLTAGVRWLLKFKKIIAIVIGVLWIVTVIVSIIGNAADPESSGVILNTILWFVMYPVLAALAAAALIIAVLFLMLVEAIAKQITSLLIYEELTLEAENIADYLVVYLLNPPKAQKK